MTRHRPIWQGIRDQQLEAILHAGLERLRVDINVAINTNDYELGLTALADVSAGVERVAEAYQIVHPIDPISTVMNYENIDQALRDAYDEAGIEPSYWQPQ